VNEIAVIDYKAGNLTSVMKALDALGCNATVTADPEVVRKASKVVLPGVGHFQATRLLEETGLTAAVSEVIARGIPFLGICVGLQWLFEGSTEAATVPGLGLFDGQCERFSPGVKVPHVGWNQVTVAPESRLMRGVENGAFVYYTHSFRAPVVSGTAAVTDYGGAFSGAVERDNVMGVQFHPEKSGTVGMRVLRNFVELEC
jgi:imidazole glycerol-phosphate synthase subunit HisH